MKVTKIILCSVPFDNTYSKVFDYKEDNVTEDIFYQNYYDKILSHFAVKTITIEKALKLTNKSTQLNIAYLINDVKNINYVVIVNDTKYMFFFVNGIYSLNDGKNPSSSLSLEWDSWSNNLYYLNKNTSKSVIQCKHFQRVKYNLSSFINNYISYEKNTLPIKENEYYKSDVDRYDVLMLRAFVDKDYFFQEDKKFNIVLSKGKFLPTGVPDTPSIPYLYNVSPSSYKDIGSKNILKAFYAPLGVYDKSTRKFSMCKFTSSYYSLDAVKRNKEDESYAEDGTFNIYGETIENGVDKERTQTGETFNISLKSDLNTYISSYELTYNCPFNYKVKNINNEITVEIKSPLLKAFETSGSINDYTNDVPLTFFTVAQPYTFKDTTDDKYYYVLTYKTDIGYKTIETKQINFEDEIGLTDKINSVCTSIQSDTDYVKNNNDLDFEPRLWEYPYRYFSVLFNDEKYDLIPQRYNTNIFSIEKNYASSEVLLKIKMDGKYIRNFIGSYVGNSGTVSYSLNAKDDYLLRNGNTRMANIISSTLKNSFNVIENTAKQNYGGIVNGFIGLYDTALNDNARMADLANAPTITKSNSLAENDTYRQDRIFITKSECFTNSFTYSKMQQLYYLIGYKENSIDNVMNNNRLFFDYCQTSNCSINSKINIEDKKIIEKAFNDGITKFHYRVLNNIEYCDFNMEQQMFNCETIILGGNE